MTGTWNTFTAPSGCNADTMLLLTDGSVLVHDSNRPSASRDFGGANWFRLTPDNHGDYRNGTWSGALPMAGQRQFFSSGVLKDGRVVVGIRPERSGHFYGPDAQLVAGRSQLCGQHRFRRTPLLRRLRPQRRNHGMVLRSLRARQGEPRRLARVAIARKKPCRARACDRLHGLVRSLARRGQCLCGCASRLRGSRRSAIMALA